MGEFMTSAIEVRLCPATCQTVRGHPYRLGKKVRIFEKKDGWARVSSFLNRAELTSNFGSNLPAKPALWVPLSAFEAKEEKPETAEQKAGDPFVAETKQEDSEKKKPAARAQVQQKRVTLPTFRPGTVFKKVAELDEQKPDEKAVETQPAADTEKKAETAEKPAEQEPKEAEPAGETPPMPKKEELKSPAKLAEAKKDAAAEKVTEPAKPEPKVETVTEEAKPAEADAEIPAESAADDKPATPENDVTEVAKAADETEQPAATEAKTETADKAEEKTTSNEPQFSSQNVEPLTFEERPTKYVKALDDKRLRKLPGRKSKAFKREEVIALRHHALMLLRNKECTGIDRGGRSFSQKGWLYVVCTDDPSYFRQFPLEETTW